MPDPTPYGRDLFSEDFRSLAQDDEGRRNLADLAEFTIKFEALSDTELLDEWPELFAIYSTPAIAMYRRAAAETRKVLAAYPAGKQLLA